MMPTLAVSHACAHSHPAGNARSLKGGLKEKGSIVLAKPDLGAGGMAKIMLRIAPMSTLRESLLLSFR